MTKIRPANQITAHKLSFAIQALKEARSFLRFAGCPKTLRRVRLCLTSAQGAERHMRHRLSRTNRDGTTCHYTESPR